MVLRSFPGLFVERQNFQPGSQFLTMRKPPNLDDLLWSAHTKLRFCAQALNSQTLQLNQMRSTNTVPALTGLCKHLCAVSAFRRDGLQRSANRLTVQLWLKQFKQNHRPRTAFSRKFDLIERCHSQAESCSAPLTSTGWPFSWLNVL